VANSNDRSRGYSRLVSDEQIQQHDKARRVDEELAVAKETDAFLAGARRVVDFVPYALQNR
jgi:hypothetical protein